MSLGISPDLRFKLEYYGSTQHVFNELELEGHMVTRANLMLGKHGVAARVFDKPYTPKVQLYSSSAAAVKPPNIIFA